MNGRRRLTMTRKPLKLDTELTTQVNTRVPEAQVAALKAVQVRVGIPVSEQIRRAIGLWLATQQGGK